MAKSYDFSQASMAKINRSKFKMNFDHKFTFNVGRLIPHYIQEVLPGDTIHINSSAILRTSTLLAPVMDNLILDYYYFFVPNRIMYDKWVNLMGESEGAWFDEEAEYEVPVIDLKTASGESGLTCGIGQVCDYMGIPTEVDYTTVPNIDAVKELYRINGLPVRAYRMIYNDWFRDQNMIDPEVIDKSDDTQYDVVTFGSIPYKVAKYHDYFTSLLPSPQKGPSVYIPFSEVMLPVGASDQTHYGSIDGDFGVLAKDSSNNAIVSGKYLGVGSGGAVARDGGSSFTPVSSIKFTNLWATNALTGAEMGAPTVNALRLAFQIQRIYEKDARGGSRYIEMLWSHFNVISPDSRQQRPEFLGGGSQVLGVQQVAQTGVTTGGSTNGVGNMGAFSFTAHNKGNFEKSFTEHGFIIGVCVVRYKHTYAQGIARFWQRKTRFDYYDPSLAHIGEQPVYKTEIVGALPSLLDANVVLGYNEAWADYRYNANRVSGYFRPYVTGGLGLWHYADDYDAVPTLNQTFIEENLEPVDRTLAVQSTVTHQIICDFYFDITATRAMPLYSVPGMLDHF